MCAVVSRLCRDTVGEGGVAAYVDKSRRSFHVQDVLVRLHAVELRDELQESLGTVRAVELTDQCGVHVVGPALVNDSELGLVGHPRGTVSAEQHIVDVERGVLGDRTVKNEANRRAVPWSARPWCPSLESLTVHARERGGWVEVSPLEVSGATVAEALPVFLAAAPHRHVETVGDGAGGCHTDTVQAR